MTSHDTPRDDEPLAGEVNLDALADLRQRLQSDPAQAEHAMRQANEQIERSVEQARRFYEPLRAKQQALERRAKVDSWFARGAAVVALAALIVALVK